MVPAAVSILEDAVTQDPPEFDPAPEADEGPEASPQAVSKLKLVVAILVMLIPAGVPLYFALGADGTTTIVLTALAGAVALINVMLVYGVWSWVNSMNSSTS